ncbi:MAG: hypothetical protein BWZ10_01881 [candidate division BRC1 bacterium ADurb.BinA364]|nr:MAG: hypothetical protein BWZ10_01881 [candidate division BRC1 bacterium ADurb.BinA364]
MILYSRFLDDVVADLARTVGMFQHLDPARIACIAQSRSASSRYGALADCVTLGMSEEPTLSFRYDKRRLVLLSASPWFVPRNRQVVLGGRRMLYLLRFRFPRFLEHSPLDTIVHELLHIGERFDGALRALPHGRWFERYVAEARREWTRKGDPALAALAQCGWDDLLSRFGSVACRCFRRPFKTPLRLPCAREGGWLEHPQARQLGLRLPDGPVAALPLVFDDPATLELREADLEYRVFHANGSQRIAAALAESHPDWA